MSKALKIVLIVLAAIIVVGGAITGGWFLGGARANAVASAVATQQANGTTTDDDQYIRPGFGPGKVPGTGMMGNRDDYGMMNGRGNRGHGGMMQGYSDANVTPLTIDQAAQAAQKYIDSLNLPDLKIAEVMIFDNGAYVRVIEKSTGIGTFELLVDPVSQEVEPEHGANMMWNLKYGGLAHHGMMNWTSGTVPADVSPDMAVTPAEATQDAQKYLDANVPGTTASTTPDAFYGYYTVEVMKDGNVYGMLSVNGSTGQVIYHHWHGTFIEMSEEK